MRKVLALSLRSSKYNYDKVIVVGKVSIRIMHFGCDCDDRLLWDLAKHYDGEFDVIAIEPSTFVDAEEIASRIVLRSHLVTGEKLKSTYIPWVLEDLARHDPSMFQKKRIGLICASQQEVFLDFFKEHSSRIYSLDPYLHLKLPFALSGIDQIRSFIPKLGVLKLFGRRRKNKFFPVKKRLSSRFAGFLSSHYFVGNEFLFDLLDKEFLYGKSVILSAYNVGLIEELTRCGVSRIISCLPKKYDVEYLNFAMIEAIMMVSGDSVRTLSLDDIINWVSEHQIKPEVINLRELVPRGSKVNKFAFIIHPLSKDYYFNAPALKPIKPFRSLVGGLLERVTSHLTGIYYGRITGVVSKADGVESEGIIYSVFETPKKMLESSPESIYRKLVAICEAAEREGAEIIGLGAYTKVIGDAGVTVDRLSPIPVTTGNSLSASSTLWAAKECVYKMGFVSSNEQGKATSSAVVIGATGSIGSVVARILARIFCRVVIVARRPSKLLDLRQTILEESPECQVVAASEADPYLEDCHLIITTTSNQSGKRLLDIDRVMPGTVICDVSRPFDVTKEEALTRPDVLVMANGEVVLPGEVKINCELGLSGKVVYACLAETALLSLEGRLESFTLSRNISVEKVKEIYRMARKHGVELAEITGPTGLITDAEIELCREHALARIKERRG
jgi:predicted amino acid dehydrogenase